jgi:hypothetical protein
MLNKCYNIFENKILILSRLKVIHIFNHNYSQKFCEA